VKGEMYKIIERIGWSVRKEKRKRKTDTREFWSESEVIKMTKSSKNQIKRQRF